jgi:thiol-disulfide isomerase/thioredoxin
VQPASPRHEETYGLDAFVGSATYVVLLAGWCGYCQSQAAKLEEMRKELTDAGKKFTMVAINSGDAAGEQTNLTSRCSFPVFQDTPERTAWTAHGGGKDDMFFYGADGRLRTFLRAGGKINTNLSMPEGYDNVKKLLLEAIGQ